MIAEFWALMACVYVWLISEHISLKQACHILDQSDKPLDDCKSIVEGKSSDDYDDIDIRTIEINLVKVNAYLDTFGSITQMSDIASIVSLVDSGKKVMKEWRERGTRLWMK